MKRKSTRDLLGTLMSLYTRVIFVGLMVWAFLLYTRSEWMMW